jgi:hypothetical protein
MVSARGVTPTMADKSVTFTDPTRVVIEASIDVIFDQHLDTFNGEQYDAIEDVVRITWHRDTIEFVTVRTLARPWRGEYHVPRAAVERCIY